MWTPTKGALGNEMTARITGRSRLVAGLPATESSALGASAIRHRLAGGGLVKLNRGAYVTPSLEWSVHRDLLSVALASPGVVFGLFTALHIHDLLGQAGAVWVCIGHRDRKPAAGEIPLEVVRCGADFLDIGVAPRAVEGVELKVTTPARTVVDCFKARARVGLDVAVQALADARRLRLATADEIWSLAERCRMCEVISPYLRAIW